MIPATKEAKKAIRAAGRARWKKIHSATSKSLEPLGANGASVVVMKALPAAPMMLDGTDKTTAKQLDKLFTDAQTGMRRIVALGLFAWELKESKLKHGQFSAWLAAHCPKLATTNEAGQPRPSRALQGYMDLTRSVLENVGFPTVEKYLATIAKSANNALLKPGAFLLIADKKVPEDLKEVREKICELVDGKTQRSLFSEFKQSEDGETVKKGRTKGHGGATKEQRVNAEELERQERITEMNLKMREVGDWLIENSDDAGFGREGVKHTEGWTVLENGMKQALGYMRHANPADIHAALMQGGGK